MFYGSIWTDQRNWIEKKWSLIDSRENDSHLTFNGKVLLKNWQKGVLSSLSCSLSYMWHWRKHKVMNQLTYLSFGIWSSTMSALIFLTEWQIPAYSNLISCLCRGQQSWQWTIYLLGYFSAPIITSYLLRFKLCDTICLEGRSDWCYVPVYSLSVDSLVLRSQLQNITIMCHAAANLDVYPIYLKSNLREMAMAKFHLTFLSQLDKFALNPTNGGFPTASPPKFIEWRR